MSTHTTPAQSGAKALGDRSNWWGESHEIERATDHVEYAGTSYESWVAGKLLRGPGATLYCPECWADGRAAELTDPEHYVPESRITVETPTGEFEIPIYGSHKRHRSCTVCGYVSWGGVLADRPMGEFIGIVRSVLDAVDTPQSRRDELLSGAQSRKANDVPDEPNMERVIRTLRNPGAEY